ncbi:MAG TPA: dodecin [Burkholderiales bacterium]
MSGHVYKHIELTGSSTEGIEDAARRALARAAATVRNMRWFEITGTRGHIENGKVAHWQVTLKVGFTLEE